MTDTDTARMSALAEIHWMLAHAVLEGQGHAAISETAVRSIAHATGAALPPLRKGVRPDLEAFITPLDQFKKKYSSFFEGVNTEPQHFP
jgi:avirulence protein